MNGKQFAGISTDGFIAAMNAEGIPNQASYPPLHELDMFRNGEYRKRLSGPQATAEHAFLRQIISPNPESAAWETVWFPQPVLLGDETDMREIVAASRKIQANAKEIAAHATPAPASGPGLCRNPAMLERINYRGWQNSYRIFKRHGRTRGSGRCGSRIISYGFHKRREYLARGSRTAG